MAETKLAADDTRWICERARAIGFELCGVTAAEKFPELQRFPEWLDRGYAGEMKYLRDPRRLDPQSAMHSVRSLIVCALNYNSGLPYSTNAAAQQRDRKPRGWISRYAWGDDYHQVLWSKLNAIVGAMKQRFAACQPFEARAYADTGPIHERAAAKYAGLGWLGKNTLLINQGAGSWLFLGTILTSLELTPSLGPDELPAPDRCGTCRVPGRLPDRGDCRTLRARRQPLYFVSDHRVARFDRGRFAPAHGRARFRLRHLPGCLPLEPQIAAHGCRGISAAETRRRLPDAGKCRFALSSRPAPVGQPQRS